MDNIVIHKLIEKDRKEGFVVLECNKFSLNAVFTEDWHFVTCERCLKEKR